MSTTSTFSFNPALSNLTLSAYSRIGIRRTEITAQHMADAEQEANLVQVELSNKVPNLWLDELYTQVLTEGTATYTLPARLVAFQAAYITTSLNGVDQDRVIWALSTFEYASVPDKTQQAPPTSFWLDMQATPQITFWPVPDSSAEYVFKARMLRQIQDASIPSGTNVDVPYRWLDCYVAKLAYRLARIYARDIEAQRKQDAQDAWDVAAETDQEQVPIYIQPDFSGYYR